MAIVLAVYVINLIFVVYKVVKKLILLVKVRVFLHKKRRVKLQSFVEDDKAFDDDMKYYN